MIGVFDSGVGGLTVLTALRAQLPNEDIVYLADQAYAPYGSLPESAIIDRCRRICEWFIEQGVQLIVVACNTATALAIETLRQEFNVPFVGIEPGIKPAALHSKTGEVCVLATENTVLSRRFVALLNNFKPLVNVHSIGCVGLASAIESDPDQAVQLLHKHLLPMVETNIDHIVLGCTHYPLLRNEIQRYFDCDLTVVDTGEAVALETARVRQAMPCSEQTSGSSPSLVLVSTQANNQMEMIVDLYDSLRWLKGVSVGYQVI